MALGNPEIIMLPRVRPPYLRRSMMDWIWLSFHGIGGPPIRTWSTPNCFTRRMPASSRLPADAGMRRVKQLGVDRKSTRLNSSHGYISYAVFCLKKKTNDQQASLVEVHDLQHPTPT